MMLIYNQYSIYLLLAANIVLLGAATIAILRLQQMVNQSERFWRSPTGSALQTGKSSGKQQDAGLERRVAALSKTIDALAEGRSAANAQNAPTLPLENAARMAKQGASVEDITKNCGLNVGEARLLKRLHTAQSEKPAAA